MIALVLLVACPSAPTEATETDTGAFVPDATIVAEAAGAEAGGWLASDGGTLVIGAEAAKEADGCWGAAYAFADPFAGGTLADASATLYSSLGGDVGIGACVDGDTIIVGSRHWLADGAVDGGAAYVVEAPAGRVDLASQPGLVLGSGEQDLAGIAVSCGGDVTGDGLNDVFVGARGGGAEDAGAVYLLAGPITTTVTTNDAAIALTGATAGAFAGRALDLRGDLDGDGLPDLAVGAYAASKGAGAVFVVTGGASGSLADADLRVDGGAAGASLGRSVWTRDDLDGDGLADLLAGAPGTGADRHGEARAWSGERELLRFVGTTEQGWAGYAVATGDFDGDGRADVVVGAPGEHGEGDNETRPGNVMLVYGGAEGTVEADRSFEGLAPGDSLGIGLTLSDFDDDGADDMALGAYGVGDHAGAVYLVGGGG